MPQPRQRWSNSRLTVRKKKPLGIALAGAVTDMEEEMRSFPELPEYGVHDVNV
jgi:hypothetical protein